MGSLCPQGPQREPCWGCRSGHSYLWLSCTEGLRPSPVRLPPSSPGADTCSERGHTAPGARSPRPRLDAPCDSRQARWMPSLSLFLPGNRSRGQDNLKGFRSKGTLKLTGVVPWAVALLIPSPSALLLTEPEAGQSLARGHLSPLAHASQLRPTVEPRAEGVRVCVRLAAGLQRGRWGPPSHWALSAAKRTAAELCIH